MTLLQREPILVVEDDLASREMLSEQLRQAGYDPLCASSGGEAIRIFQERGPQIVLSDWCMNGIDGLSLCRMIRKQQGSRLVYFVMLTVNAAKAKVVEAFDAGVDDFLVKPVCHEEMLARLRAAERTVRLYTELAGRAAHIEQLNRQLTQLNGRLTKLACVDELTGIPNRRHGLQTLRELWLHASRYDLPLACAMVDIDHFKLVNDEFGHIKGDEVLQKVSATLKNNIRDCDSLCRMGGEEFLIIFPQQTAQQAAICMERCCRVIRHQAMIGQPYRPVTVSVGIAARDASTRNADDLVRQADNLLYQAKKAGRDRICTAGIDCSPAGFPEPSVKADVSA